MNEYCPFFLAEFLYPWPDYTVIISKTEITDRKFSS